MRRETKKTDKIVNLTKKTVNLYDDATGEIRELRPEYGRLQSPVTDLKGQPQVYYIVERDEVAEISASGRRLDDLAIVRDTGVGRGGINVSFLVSAEDIRNRVLLRNAAKLNVA